MKTIIVILLFSTFGFAETFKDIKPTLETHCASCHNPNWVEKNWLDYKTAKENKDKIKLRVENETMPPGNVTGMTKAERQKIINWVNGGAKE